MDEFFDKEAPRDDHEAAEILKVFAETHPMLSPRIMRSLVRAIEKLEEK